MRKTTYRHHRIELISDQLRTGEWVARANVWVGDGNSIKKIPIFGRRRTCFQSKRAADAYALELAKLWVDGKLWGGNGRG